MTTEERREYEVWIDGKTTGQAGGYAHAVWRRDYWRTARPDANVAIVSRKVTTTYGEWQGEE